MCMGVIGVVGQIHVHVYGPYAIFIDLFSMDVIFIRQFDVFEFLLNIFQGYACMEESSQQHISAYSRKAVKVYRLHDSPHSIDFTGNDTGSEAVVYVHYGDS